MTVQRVPVGVSRRRGFCKTVAQNKHDKFSYHHDSHVCAGGIESMATVVGEPNELPTNAVICADVPDPRLCSFSQSEGRTSVSHR